MSSHDSPSLAIERSARSHLTVVATVMVILCIVPWLATGFSVLASLAIMILGMAWATYSFWRTGWLGEDRAVHKVVWAADGEWHLINASDAGYSAKLTASSQVIGPIVWLRFASESGTRDLVFLGNALVPNTRRKLVVRLRLQGANDRPRSGNLAVNATSTGTLREPA